MSDPAAAKAVVAKNGLDPPQSTFKETANVICAPDRPSLRRRFWIARESSGDIVGLVIALLPLTDNPEVVVAEIRVLPAARRHGTGTALLSAMLSDATLTTGRSLLTGFSVAVGSDGERWAAGLGFQRTQELVQQVLPVSETDPNLWHVPAPDGFTLESWSGAAPNHLVTEYAHARSAMADAPVGDSSFQEPEWTAERVREREAFERNAGRHLWAVAAVATATGRIAGMTEMNGYPEQDTVTFQKDTAVLAEFRGNGLGRAMKAAMMRTLSTERPRLERVETITAADNEYMIKVNHDLGYVTTHTTVTMEADIANLRSRLRGKTSS